MKKLVKIIEGQTSLRVDIYETDQGFSAERFNQGVFLLRENHSDLDSAIRHSSEWTQNINLLNE